MKLTWLIGVTGAALFAAACGSDDGDVSLEDFPEDLQQRVCANGVECGDYPDLATCLESGELSIDTVNIQKDLDDGVISFDSGNAAACLNAFDQFTQGCELNFDSAALQIALQACEDTFEGTIAIGGVCTDDEQCVGTGECERDCAQECCEGACVAGPSDALIAIGQSCEGGATCESGAYCESDDNTCKAKIAEGGACDSFLSCAGTSLCDLDFQTGVGTCKSVPDEGETCDPERLAIQCLRTDNYCDPADTTCKKVVDVGATCNLEIPNCVGYAECIDGTCAARPKLGESCVVDGQLDCLGNLDCVAGTCTLNIDNDYCPLGG